MNAETKYGGSKLPPVLFEENDSSHNKDDTNKKKDYKDKNDDTRYALFLGGWSNGPLPYLQSALPDHYRVIQPSIPIPPIAGGWCWSSRVWGMILVWGLINWLLLKFFFYVWQSSTLDHRWMVAVLGEFSLLVWNVFWFRWVVGVIVRTSVQTGCDIVRQTLQHYYPAVDIVIGFSWGGAVLAELLATSTVNDLDDDDHKVPPMLLLAPTTAVVAMIAGQVDAAWRFPRNGGCLNSHVIHAQHDTLFCPHRERWQQQQLPAMSTNRTSTTTSATTSRSILEAPPSFKYSLLSDNHILSRRSSRDFMIQAMFELMERRMRHSK